MQKIAEGGYNKVFRLLMDDGKAVIARISNPNAGPRFYTTASKVATMEFVSDHTLFAALLCCNRFGSRLGQYSIYQPPRCTAGT